MIAHNDCNLTMHKIKIFSRRKQGCHFTWKPGKTCKNMEKPGIWHFRQKKTWKNLEFENLGKKKTGTLKKLKKPGKT